MSILELSNQAIRQHNVIVDQRIRAINNANTTVMEEIRNMNSCINSMIGDYNEIMNIRVSINTVATHLKSEVARMKRDMQVIRNCNYYYLQINPIITHDDLLRYDEFLTMSYKVLNRDIIAFNTVAGENIVELQKLQNEFNEKNKPSDLE